MTCSLCGIRFDINTAHKACSSCPMNKSCKMFKCPNCGYECLPEPELFKFIKKLLKNKNSGYLSSLRNSLFPLAKRCSRAFHKMDDSCRIFTSLPKKGYDSDMLKREQLPLTGLNANQTGTIVDLDTSDPKKLQKLMVMGALPGATIELIQKFPSYVFRIDNTQVAVDAEIAGNILVRPN